MSAAFGAGDMTSANNAGGGGGASASNVGGVLGNTISLDEIMRATKTNVRRTWARAIPCSRSILLWRWDLIAFVDVGLVIFEFHNDQ